jgi:hypothetical protein
MTSFYDRIVVSRPVAKPKSKDIWRFQRETGIALPPSYTAFIRRFGPGELGALLRITAPGYPKRPAIDLLAFSRRINVVSMAADYSFECRGGASSLLFFGSNYGGDLFAWDTSQHANGEYRIIAFPRHNQVAVELARTFKRLIADVVRGVVKEPVGGLGPETAAERRAFRPAMTVEPG